MCVVRRKRVDHLHRSEIGRQSPNPANGFSLFSTQLQEKRKQIRVHPLESRERHWYVSRMYKHSYDQMVLIRLDCQAYMICLLQQVSFLSPESICTHQPIHHPVLAKRSSNAPKHS